MRIKKYVAKSMREALLQIKDELGEDAIILKTRKLQKNLFGLVGPDEVEVTAAVDEEAAPKTTSFAPLKVTDPGVYGYPRSQTRTIPVVPSESPVVKPWVPSRTKAPNDLPDSIPEKIGLLTKDRNRTVAENREISELKENIRELQNMVKTMVRPDVADLAVPAASPKQKHGELHSLYKKLIDAEVNAELADRLIANLDKLKTSASDPDLEKKFVQALGDHFPVSGALKLKKGGPLVVAFIGPTGSGKTTTLAKLAAHCCLNKGKRVSIITADTYRIAAIEQIRMFADIVKVGLQVVFSSEEIPAALAACENDEIVFVDTAGRSQRNREHMEDLQEFLDVLKPDETHLVVSATTKDSDLLDTVERYRPFNINRLLFTKLDETVRYGNILNVVSATAVPVSYFTFGQSVPDDIELAQPAKFVSRLREGPQS